MKMNKLLLGAAIAALSVGGLTACGSAPAITVWVGQESVEFYQKAAKEFLAANPDFAYDIQVTGADSGGAAGQLATDNSACADIVTIAHDNIGKLSQKSLILPITDEGLVNQIENETMDAFKGVIKNKLGAGADAREYIFGVPYISQALFLFYNTKYVTPEQARTFEGLKEAAKAQNKKAFTVTGTDSFNLSFTTLALREKDKYTSVKIYEDGKKSNCFFQGNDSIAVSRWAQKEFQDKNGGLMPTSNGWAVDMKNENVLSTIGGAWHLNSAVSALGAENVGFSLIPTFKMTAEAVEGLEESELGGKVPTVGDEYRGGTFADCKCMVINMASDVEKTASINQLVKYFSSKEVQKQSFLEAGNVPAFKGAADYVATVDKSASVDVKLKVEMAEAQLRMGEYGIPQPFNDGIKNTYFYSKGCDALLKDYLVDETKTQTTLRAAQELHYKVQHTWEKGGVPDKLPTNLPEAI